MCIRDRAEDGGDFYVDTILGTYYVSMNLQRDAFKEAKVRKALALAIDRDYVANTIMQGTYSAAVSYTHLIFCTPSRTFC